MAMVAAGHLQSRSTSSGVLGFLKTILLPALISLTLYVLLFYLLLPFLRRHRHRYNQYAPLNSLSTSTASIRHRIYDGLVALLLPSAWTRHRDGQIVDGSDRRGGGGGDDDDDDDESMVGLEADRQSRDPLDRQSDFTDSERRLSRELEEGFRDDSDDETEDSSVRAASTAGPWRATARF